ncbi:MAG: substrate-binding domain-containing protein, partial [Planctomycetota bacterium JB042]
PGDVAYRVLGDLPPPGVVVHGVALKPGKPLCLAVAGDTPVVVLPGFPTSALFTFHEFVAPVVRRLAGRRDDRRGTRRARMPVRVHSERGRTEYLLVNLVPGDGLPAAYPLGKGSGSVTTWSRADGFVVLDRNRELLDEGSEIDVTLLGRDLEPKDLVLIGSHCVGTDLLVAALARRGWSAKSITVGSEGGLLAARRGECDAAGLHLFDPESGTYNAPFVDDSIELVPGYGRMQGVVFRRGDPRFEGRTAAEAVAAVAADEDVVMVNRNRGSGTRVLVDGLLGEARPRGHANEARTHHAVCASVAAGRADFGVAIETVAREASLGFLPVQEERYDFAIPRARRDRDAVRALVETLASETFREELRGRGFRA